MTQTYLPFFTMSSDIMMILDAEGKILAINRAGETRLQKSGDAIKGTCLFDFTPTDAHERLSRILADKQVGEPAELVTEFRTASKTVDISKFKFCFDPLANQFAVVCYQFLSLDEDEAIRWKLALESSDAGFWSWDISSDVIYFSDRLETMLGYTPGELPLVFETLRSLVHPEDAPKNAQHVVPFIKGERDRFKFECRVRRKTGEYMWIQAMGARTTDSKGRETAIGWHFDIDELKRTEEQLKSSEERTQFLLSSIPDLLFVFDPSGVFIEVHTSKPESLLHPKDQLIGRTLTEIMPPPIATEWSKRIRQVVATGLPQVGEYSLELPSGTEFFEARLFPRADGTIVAIIRDVTARRAAEAAALEAEQRLSGFLQNSPATMFTFVPTDDGDARYTFIAGRVREMFEKSANEMLGTALFKNDAPFIHHEDRESAVEALKSASETVLPINWLGRYVLPSGRISWINAVVTPVHAPDGSLQFNGIAFDVTRERELAQQVQEQQVLMSSSSRLTALGEMAGGIAHEINNPLTVAHAYASRLRDMAEAGKHLDPETVIKSAQKIESVCMRISRIIAGLRSIARDGDNDRFVLAPLKPIIEDALSLSTEKFRHRQIELIVERLPENLSIECRSVQISQVLVNLLLNAQHAVEVMPGTRWIRLSVLERPSTVELRISDSGPGIPPEIRDRVFDPFFTTKEVGKGTGLGLSISAAIAEAHGGALYLDENDANTTFVLILQRRHNPGARAVGDQ